ncbi:MAG: helicase SNF2, partial [Bacteroidia bacterium]
MALPHLIKFVYTHGTDEVIRRGKKIHAIGFVELVEYDELFGSAVFRVKDDSYSTFYKVYIQKFKDPKSVSVRCGCPYNLGDICRHEAASLFQLQEMMDRGHLQSEEVQYDQRHTIAKMKFIDLKTLRMLSSQEAFTEAEKFLRSHKANIESAGNETVKASVPLDGKHYKVIIRKNEERNFDTSCDYEDKEHPLCLPKLIVFLQLLNSYGSNYFDSIRNWDKEKNKLLEAYGYSLNDDLAGKFEFSYKDGKPFLRVLDSGIKRVAPVAVPLRPLPMEQPVEVKVPEIQTEEIKKSQRIGVVFNCNKKNFPYFSIDVITGEVNDEGDGFVGKAEKLDISRYVDTEELCDGDKQLLAALRKLQETEINKYISRNSPFSGIWENIIHQEEDDLPEETKELIAEYLLPKLKKLFAEASGNTLTYILPPKKSFKTNNLESLQLSADEARPHFIVKKNSHYSIQCRVKAGGMEYALEENEINSPLFFSYNNQLFLWKNNEVVHLVEKFLPEGKMNIPQEEWNKTLHQFILPLAREHKVDFDKSIVQEVKDGDPDVKLFLMEKGDYLVFQPSFSYKGYETRAKDRDDVVAPQGEKVIIVRRNREAEN